MCILFVPTNLQNTNITKYVRISYRGKRSKYKKNCLKILSPNIMKQIST